MSAVPGTVAAVLDVGSNSVLLLTVAVGDDGRARAVDEALATTRLGAGLLDGGPLDPAARERTRAAVVSLADRARARGATTVWAFATAAARRASDGAAFMATLGREAGCAVEVVSGAREATLAYAAVAAGLGLGGPVLAVDVGGGTTELTRGAGDAVVEATSLPLGALRLAEAVAYADPPGPAGGAALDAAIAPVLDGARPLLARARGAACVASGGTATALAALDLGLATYDPARVHGHVLEASRLTALVAELLATPAEVVRGRGGLDPGRARILPAGAAVLAAVVRATGAPALRVSDHGVRHAYLRERLAERGVRADLRRLWG